MRFLVSGASGLIGSALVARLQKDHETVHRVVRADPQDGDAYLDVANGQLDCSRLPDGSLDRIDVVVNLAGERITPLRWSAEKRERLRASRIVVTDVLAHAIAKSEQPPAVFVSASATGYYGDRGDEQLDEESAPGGGFLAELCRAWERAAEPASDAGIRTVCIRSGPVIARHSPLIAGQLPFFRLGLGAHLGSGRQWMSWIAIDDAVDGIIHAALTPMIDGPCNLVAPNPVRNAEFARAFGRAVGRPAGLSIPRPLLFLLMGGETTRQLALASQRVVPSKLAATGFSFSCNSIDEALHRAIGGD